MLYTAQYRYSGQDRLDITVKGNDIAGKMFAPTWKMVTGFKNGFFTEEEYTIDYYNLLTWRWKNNEFDIVNSVPRLVDIVVGGKNNMPPRDITLVCFCPANTFCHRHLLVKWLIHNWPQVQYGGERGI